MASGTLSGQVGGDRSQLGERLRLLQKSVDPAPDRFHLDLGRAVAGQHDGARPRRALARETDQLQALVALHSGQPQVGDHERVADVRQERLGLFQLAGAVDLVAPRLEVVPDRREDRLLVVHYKKTRLHRECSSALTQVYATWSAGFHPRTISVKAC